MKIIDARIKWNEGLGNSPDLYLLVDSVPGIAELRYEIHGSIYHAEMDGFVQFGHYNFERGGNQDGYGGREWEITMLDGTTRMLRGPWSSNSAAVNAAGFPHCKECFYTSDERVLHHDGYMMANAIDFRGGEVGFLGGAISVDLAIATLARFPELGAAIAKDDVKLFYHVVTIDGRRKPSQEPEPGLIEKIITSS